ncbi:MAG: hypothetical protein IJU53_00455, partial [Thermoguttaceae bacterium]|nr:hypothetical protein [Thermoguttaceae bacterium]
MLNYLHRVIVFTKSGRIIFKRQHGPSHTFQRAANLHRVLFTGLVIIRPNKNILSPKIFFQVIAPRSRAFGYASSSIIKKPLFRQILINDRRRFFTLRKKQVFKIWKPYHSKRKHFPAGVIAFNKFPRSVCVFDVMEGEKFFVFVPGFVWKKIPSVPDHKGRTIG